MLKERHLSIPLKIHTYKKADFSRESGVCNNFTYTKEALSFKMILRKVKPRGVCNMVNKDEGNFLKGLLFGTSISIPLWISFFGWIKIIITKIF